MYHNMITYSRTNMYMQNVKSFHDLCWNYYNNIWSNMGTRFEINQWYTRTRMCARVDYIGKLITHSLLCLTKITLFVYSTTVLFCD